MVDTSKLIGKNIITTGGVILGEVKGTHVNTNTWQLTYLQVKLSAPASEMLGFKKRFRSSIVCMPVSLVSAVGDVITIARTLRDLSENPEIIECPE
ncbi:MAG: PRC-barrel domain-containing protein [Candidatus Bathyarchaeota archaeon]|nr:PRC-barrel domain-containing protein [Candidatus Bathyarchaeota archaeon]